MENHTKNFLKGAISGIAVAIVLYFLFTGFYRAYLRHNNATIAPDRKLEEIMSVLDKNYVDDYDKTQLVESMYAGFVYGVGDPYTNYMDKDTLKNFYEQTNGKYAGIGIRISVDNDDNRIKIVTVFGDSPSERAGLQAEDKIVKVNGLNVYGETYEDAVTMLKGRPGTKVNLTILRELENKTFDVDVMREDINVPTISHKMLEGDIGYINIMGFERVTYDQFMIAYNDLQQKNMKGLIIDVRNNPGGLLDIVCKIADELVPKGFIVYTEDKSGHKEYIYSNDKRINIPLVMVVNKNSASASEVLSGAVQDMKIGELVGTQTYGKGLVQNLFELSDGSAIKVTVAKYYTPNGVCINGEGLTPDYLVELDKEKTIKIPNLEVEEDDQLKKAIEVIKEKIE